MKPKKSKELIPLVSKETGISQLAVEAITKMYWREVWENVTSLSAPKIHIDNFGDFNIKHWLLDKEIMKCEYYESKTTMKGSQRYLAGLKIKDRIRLLNNIKEEINKENQRKEFIHEHKKINKESIADLEKQETDITRTIL